MQTDKELSALHRRLDSQQKLIDQQVATISEFTNTISDLSRDVMSLKSTVATLQLQPQPVAPQPKPTVISAADPREHGVQIRELVTRSPTFEIPSEAQTRQLLSIVSARHALFKPLGELEFHRAFLVVGELNRLPDGKLDTEHGLPWWSDTLEAFARKLSLPGSISYGAIVACCIAHGDIGFSSISNWPFIDLGIAPPMYAGRPTNNKWKLILGGATLPEPVAQPTRKPVERHVIRPVAPPW